MKRFTVRVTWAEVVQNSELVVVSANREDDAVAVAMAHVRNGGEGRRSINTVVIKRETVEEPSTDAVVVPGPGARDALADIRENMENNGL